ncbi:MAG: MmgE/PrpD family protein [Pseudomonadota bacterium]|nr:MmgE/PrpD family protein [Pseudomonadota bacterium]
MSKNITSDLANFASKLTYKKIPQEAINFTKLLILDALACALAGDNGEETEKIRALAHSLALSKESSVIGGGKLSVAGSVLMNSYLITAVTMCDTHRETLTHIMPEVLPAALAIAELNGNNGTELLTAVTIGCEIACRIGLGIDYPAFRERGWHGPGVIGPFGAAAAVGHLLKFNKEKMTHAFGLAGSQAAGTFAAWGTPTVKFHQCRGSLSGLMAAILAEQDFNSSKEILTAKDGGLYNSYSNGGKPERAVKKLGVHWEFQRIALRMWPAASGLQGMITALVNFVSKNKFSFDKIKAVNVSLSETPYQMHGRFSKYKGKFEALLSAHYTSAVILRDKKLSLSQFKPECYNNVVLKNFASDKVIVSHDKNLAGQQCVVLVHFKDGSALSSHANHQLGSPENPVSMSEVEDKFRTYGKEKLSKRRINKIVSIINEFENLENSKKLLKTLRIL